MDSAELQGFVGTWLPKLDVEMRDALANDEAVLSAYYGMLRYHMGWVDEQFVAQVSPSGKRLRPVFSLLTCAEVGGDPALALPAAAAIELLHNFSLIHDDVEDGDETRRHRSTIWALWGVPQAINAGDGMFAIAFRAMQRLYPRGVDPKISLAALAVFTETCVQLTEGQFLDIGFESREAVTVAEYMRMISGKTAALIGASVAIGALIGGAAEQQREALWRFGQAMGLAFQIQDDILGIWGDPAVTGKAAGNDILRRKKSLPLLYALNHADVGPALHTLMVGEMSEAQVPDAMDLLSSACARAYAEQQLLVQHEAGMTALHEALGERASTSALYALANGLLDRKS